MQAASYLVPALAPLAIKLIDKYIFDDRSAAQVPQVIQIPASPMCGCRCGQASDCYDSLSGTCSTCTGRSSISGNSCNNHHLSVKSSMRSSSTSDAYENEKCKSPRRARISSDSTGVKSEKKLDKHRTGENTLAILAGHLKREISHHSKGKMSSRDSKLLGTEKSSSHGNSEKRGYKMSESRKCSKSIHGSKSHRSISKF